MQPVWGNGELAGTAGAHAGDLIIAADFGTSGVKLGVVDSEFRILARAVIPYPLFLPAQNRAEQNPEDWWNALRTACHAVAREVDRLSERTAALVFCAQMCGLVCVDAQGAPLEPAMIWLDKRSAELSRDLVGGFPSIQGYQLLKLARWLRIANGAPSRNGMDPAAKMLWVKRHDPETFDKSHKLLDVKDWLIHRGTGIFSTTADSANLTWLMDTRRGREGWSATLAGHVGIPLEKMPDIVDGTSVVGALTRRAAEELGLKPGVAVLGGGGDVTATAIGSGAVADGALHICASTSSWVSGFFPRRIASVAHSYATVASSVGYRPLLIATQESAGSAFAWLSRMLERGDDQLDRLSALFDNLGSPAADEPFFVPWLAGERVPVDDERLRGTFVGLSLRHDRQTVLRSVVEGVALNTRWAYSKVAKEKGVRHDGPIPLVGGAARNAHFAQTLADALDRPVVVGDPQYSGVLGAAAIAAPALGWRGTVWDAAAAVGRNVTAAYEPAPARVARLEERYRTLERIRKSLVKLYRSNIHEGGHP